jgi:orotate phosphoribosyltransferase
MNIQDIAMDIFKETGVLRQGHFRLTSGRHSDQYMQCGRVFEQAGKAEILCKALAGLFAHEKIDMVAGPALGAMLMAYEVSRHLDCRNMFSERENGVMTFRRGFAADPGLRILVVEDTVTTGGTVRELIRLCQDGGAEVVGVGSLVDRSGGKADFGVPFRAVVPVNIESWEEKDCPLCAQGVPIIKPGSR